MAKPDKSNWYVGKEANFQIAVARYLDLKKILWFHCPNGGSRNAREAANLKRQGVKRGISDVIILEPRAIYHGLMIELKTAKGTVSKEQKEFLSKCSDKGYMTRVCRSIDEVVAIVDFYMNL